MKLSEHHIMGLLILAVIMVFLLQGCVVVHFDDPPKAYEISDPEWLPIIEPEKGWDK